MKRITSVALLLVLCLCFVHLLAQDKKKKGKEQKEQNKPGEPKDDDEKVPVFNYVVDDPMDAFGPKTPDSSTANRYFLFPEFYSYWPVSNKDTILKYECYDANHTSIAADALANADDIKYISLVKSYPDFLETTIDQDGKPRAKSVQKILYRYERTGSDSWKAHDMLNNATMDLQENKGRIVRADTTVLTNPVSGQKQLTIRKYYKVEEVGRTASEPGSDVATQMDTKNITTVVSFSVPEFYFPGPKKIMDTTLEFLCYDERDSLIPFVRNYDSVRFYSLFKKYLDRDHTYKDANGEKKPLPVSSIIKRYDRIAKDKWMSIEYPGNKYTELKGFREATVRSDSMILTDPISGSEEMHVYNYYKVIKN